MDKYLQNLNGRYINPFFQRGTITKLQKRAKAFCQDEGISVFNIT